MRRRHRVLLLVAVGLAGAGLAAAGVLPEGFVSVEEVAASPQRFAGSEVHVRALVADAPFGQAGPHATFAITDTKATLPVEYHGSLPEMFTAGRTVVVSGTLELRAEGPVLVAHGIQGGCASKYEPAPPAAEGAA